MNNVAPVIKAVSALEVSDKPFFVSPYDKGFSRTVFQVRSVAHEDPDIFITFFVYQLTTRGVVDFLNTHLSEVDPKDDPVIIAEYIVRVVHEKRLVLSLPN